MSKIKREPCPVCSQPQALNWRSREMARHREGFLRERRPLVAALANFDLDSLGFDKYKKRGEEIMQHAFLLYRLLLLAERERGQAV
jgi:hypothetical protein